LTPVTHALFGLEDGDVTEERLRLRTYGIKRLDQRRGLAITKATWSALNEFDVIHLMVFPSMAADLLILSASLRDQLVVLTDVGGGGLSLTAYLNRISPRLGLIRLAAGLAHLSNHAARLYQGWSQPSTVLFGGATFDAREMTTSGGYALFVGRLLQHKGVLELIDAIDETTPLRIVGRPYDRNYLTALTAAAKGKNIEFYFDASDEELRQHYQGASVVLQPTLPDQSSAEDRSELLGLVAIEGMSFGKPVIVTRCTSLPELVLDGVTGFVVPPRDSMTLREKVRLLVSNPQVSQRMGVAARRHVEANFTWHQTASRALEFYRELAARSGRIPRALTPPPEADRA
jgi:hypothetical protein